MFCVVLSALLDFIGNFVFLLRCGTKTCLCPVKKPHLFCFQNILTWRRLLHILNMDPGEIEFLAEKEKIDIIPNFTHGIMHLIQGTFILISYLN